MKSESPINIVTIDLPGGKQKVFEGADVSVTHSGVLSISTKRAVRLLPPGQWLGVRLVQCDG